MAIFHLLDELYCEEEKWEENDELDDNNNNNNNTTMLLEQDMFWDDDEINCLLKKEKLNELTNNNNNNNNHYNNDIKMINARKEAIEWMLKVNSYYGFNTLTSILSVNYFDRCINNIPFIQPCKPWTIQLAAVTCLSLAAKVEETHVPFLLDLQVEGARPIFEAKDIQKMEILVLSALEWKMHPVTPLSFIDHIIRRLGFKIPLHWEFLKRCHQLLLSLLSDWRIVRYLPSVLASATMMHVIDQIQPTHTLDYQSQLLNLLNINKEEVNDCYELIIEKSRMCNSKRKYEEMTTIPSSPSGVIDAFAFSSDSSNDSWVATSTSLIEPMSVPSSVSSSPVIGTKKVRVHEQPMPLQLPSISRVFVNFAGSPR